MSHLIKSFLRLHGCLKIAYVCGEWSVTHKMNYIATTSEWHKFTRKHGKICNIIILGIYVIQSSQPKWHGILCNELLPLILNIDNNDSIHGIHGI